MEYTAPENIYWLLSTSAQAIAAFVGFIAAGYYFVLQIIDANISKDNSLEEIYNEIKIENYKKLRTLLTLTAFSIVGSLILLYLNGFKETVKLIHIIFIGIINVATIVMAIKFVISIVDPNKFNNATTKLIKDDKFISTSENANTIKIEDFIKQYIQIERLLPTLIDKYNISYPITYQSKNFIGSKQIMEILKQRELIEKDLYNKFLEVNKVRNLAVHGKVDFVGYNIYEMLQEILNKLNDLNDLADTIDSM